MAHKRCLAICFVTIFTLMFGYAGASANSGLFEPYVSHPTGSWPEAVAIGDVNGDGRNDVVLTTGYYFDPLNDYRIHVFLQNASGGLNPPVKYPTSSNYTYQSTSVDIGDVNNDGRNDVVVGNSGSNIEVFLQNTSGGLQNGVTYNTVNSNSIKIGDLNNDGLLDVVGIGWGTNTAHVFLQDISGRLGSPVTYSVTHGGYDEVDVGDVNSDGLTDVVVMSGQGMYPNFAVLRQLPSGSLSSPYYYDLGGDVLSRGVAVGDISGDALNDVVLTYGGNRPSSFIGAFLQDSNGNLTAPVSYPSYDIPGPVEIEDVNGDGRNDVVVVHNGWLNMAVYLQGADGALLPYELYPIPYASWYKPQGMDVGDINGDGEVDVAIADYNNGLVLLYHSKAYLAVTPDATVVPRGGTMGYTVTAKNNTASTLCSDYWADVKLPDGSVYPVAGELLGPYHACVGPYSTRSEHITHAVPLNAPLGAYTYNAYVGPYSTVRSDLHFNFAVTGTP